MFIYQITLLGSYCLPGTKPDDAPESEDSDCDQPATSFRDLLQSFTGPDKRSKATPRPEKTVKWLPKPAAAPKTTPAPKTIPAPKVTAVPKNIAAPKGTKRSAEHAAEGSNSKVPRVAQAAIGRARRKRDQVNDDLGLTADIGDLGDLPMDDEEELSGGDKLVIEAFKSKLNALKKLDPPLADGPFKQYLQEVQSTLGGILQEVRTKKRSALRRAGRENDPLYKALHQCSEKTSEFQHVVTCILVENL